MERVGRAWYPDVVTVRHIALGAAAVLVLCMGVYLFLEVRKPASAQGHEPADKPVAQVDEAPVKAAEEPPPPAKPVVKPSGFTPAWKPAGTGKIADPNVTEPPVVEQPVDGREAMKLDGLMSEANKAYDHQDFDEARAYAQKVLVKNPTNARMLRIIVSSACIENDAAEAQKSFNLLPAGDREQMKTRCARYGITFTDPPK